MRGLRGAFACRDLLHNLRQEGVFGLEHPCGEGFGGVIGKHRDLEPGEDLTGVVFRLGTRFSRAYARPADPLLLLITVATSKRAPGSRAALCKARRFEPWCETRTPTRSLRAAAQSSVVGNAGLPRRSRAAAPIPCRDRPARHRAPRGWTVGAFAGTIRTENVQTMRSSRTPAVASDAMTTHMLRIRSTSRVPTGEGK